MASPRAHPVPPKRPWPRLTLPSTHGSESDAVAPKRAAVDALVYPCGQSEPPLTAMYVRTANHTAPLAATRPGNLLPHAYVSPSLMIPRLGIQIPRRAILLDMINRRFYWTAVPDIGR